MVCAQPRGHWHTQREGAGGREVVVWKPGWGRSGGRIAVKKACSALPPQGICRLATAAAKPKGTGTAETCPSATTVPIAPQPTARQPRRARIRFESRRTVTHASHLSRRADRPRGGPAFRRSGNQEICQPRGARSCWLCRGHRNRLPCLQRHFRHGKQHRAASPRPLTLQ